MEKNLFEKYNFQPFIQEAIADLGFNEPTEIQERLIPIISKGDSAIGQSQTGTGKTHAYILPIIEKVNPDLKYVQAVIAAPTRELASQIHQEVLKITGHAPAGKAPAVRCFIGGTDKQRTIDKLKNQPQIVVGTPGRINDLMKEQALDLHRAQMLVVDEADMMLDMGFIEAVDQFASAMPENLQMLVFSATIPEKLKPFLKKYMENPKYIQVEPKKPAAENIEHLLLPARHRNKVGLAASVLAAFNPYLAIVFANTKKMADEVADGLLAKGLKVGRVHGGLTPRERKRVMKQVKDLEFQYIVATDLAARGIDIEGVSHVVNMEIPDDLEFYIHRVGRTARAGNSGIALTIYETSDEDALNRLEKMGIAFKNMDLQKGELIEIGDRNKRQKRKRQSDDTDIKARALVKKPGKVKPGYKKKMQADIEKIKKRARRVENRKK